MGKGDRKTRRGKLFSGTFGVRRQKNRKIRKQSVHASDIQETKPKPSGAEKKVKKSEPSEAKKTAPRKNTKPEKTEKTGKAVNHGTTAKGEKTEKQEIKKEKSTDE